MAFTRYGPNKLWIPICTVVVVLCLFTGILVGWEGRIRNFKDTGYSINWNGRYILLDVNLVSIDSNAGTMVLDWYIYNDTACDQLGLTNSNNASVCSPFVKIFFDTNILQSARDPSNPANNNIPANPVFLWNATANNLSDNRTNIPAFRTSMTLLTMGTKETGVTNQQNYPFDSYYCDLFVFAQEADTNATVGVRIHSTGGVAVGYTAKTQRASDDNDPILDINDMITISRSGLVKAYAVVIVVAMWAITLVFVLATVLSVFLGYRQRMELLAIPVSTLFAFPQLRSSMPGAPLGGGIILLVCMMAAVTQHCSPVNLGTIVDYVGVLPCLALTSTCAALTLGLVVMIDPEEDREHPIKPKQIKRGSQRTAEKEPSVLNA